MIPSIDEFKSNLYIKDGYHLNEAGAKIVAANIKKYLAARCAEDDNTYKTHPTTNARNNLPGRTIQADMIEGNVTISMESTMHVIGRQQQNEKRLCSVYNAKLSFESEKELKTTNIKIKSTTQENVNRVIEEIIQIDKRRINDETMRLKNNNRICIDFMKDNCRFADRCWFKHPENMTTNTKNDNGEKVDGRESRQNKYDHKDQRYGRRMNPYVRGHDQARH